jgi:hypothetical protein
LIKTDWPLSRPSRLTLDFFSVLTGGAAEGSVIKCSTIQKNMLRCNGRRFEKEGEESMNKRNAPKTQVQEVKNIVGKSGDRVVKYWLGSGKEKSGASGLRC